MVSVKKVGLSKPRGRSLKNGRPPVLSKSVASAATSTSSVDRASKKSSKATRKLINTHHRLHKSRAKALAVGDENLVAEIDSQIEALGGLTAYQAASLTGQDKERGGDSSEKLVDWLSELQLVGKNRSASTPSLRVLEIGALSSKNAISGMIGKGIDYVKRIDLHSQEPGMIEEVDFMAFPIPKLNQDKFDVISLSLVLNYVSDPKTRGEMLRRTTEFLRDSPSFPPSVDDTPSHGRSDSLPCLFFVIPLPCLQNSRYMNMQHFRNLMSALGYKPIRTHTSNKLHYELFRHYLYTTVKTARQPEITFKKVEVNPGPGRNNFCITLGT